MLAMRKRGWVVAGSVILGLAVITAIAVDISRYQWVPTGLDGWSAAAGDDRVLVIHHMAGEAKVRVEVVETETTVQVTVWRRVKRDQAYWALGVRGTAEVRLKTSLGERQVLSTQGEPLPQKDP